ncbi:hypothetical protein C9J03_14870 [Photobacterium gaetbulicola]|uniref:Uncharacterized protein n=1 Tax=Photobacterium gaetbulicola Gung47 TaxID=658445 RepID=A0A0C5WIZ8_9GAMM|nr:MULTISPECIES: hypothetical protein [Photobacterium]AJR05139.1 hypothetical protein H744_1c0110 [Photobacterium gaetbulicola Gung47]PSU06836.1 hypothetical protein C9J03_14870 [Photobacterium gaetbulicola]WEM45030.1 hypothetical protein PTW35_18215 [Photobacterium sp. DA100]
MLSNRINQLVERALLEGDIKAKVAIEKINQKAIPDVEIPASTTTQYEEKMMLEIQLQSDRLNQNARKTATVVASLPFILFLLSLVTA